MSLAERERALLTEGIERFNRERYWDAHESWEAIWLEAADPTRRFLQGLIQLAAAFHHFQRGNLPGGIRLVDAAEEKLNEYPDSYLGVERSQALDAARGARRMAREHLEQGNEGIQDRVRFPALALSFDAANVSD